MHALLFRPRSSPLGSLLIAETNNVTFTKVPSGKNHVAFKGQCDFPWCFESITKTVIEVENNANVRIDAGIVVVSPILAEVVFVPKVFFAIGTQKERNFPWVRVRNKLKRNGGTSGGASSTADWGRGCSRRGRWSRSWCGAGSWSWTVAAGSKFVGIRIEIVIVIGRSDFDSIHTERIASVGSTTG